jgi:hypothetical protein
MKKFVLQFIGSCHHGKGSKYTRRRDFKRALEHFRAALEYASRSDDISSIPLEMECIARTLVRLGDYGRAKEFASESLVRYRKLQRATGDIFHQSANRVTELLEVIERRGTV